MPFVKLGNRSCGKGFEESVCADKTDEMPKINNVTNANPGFFCFSVNLILLLY
jgi:hypothetical protein